MKANRLVGPDLGLDGPGAVAVRGDRIVASGPSAVGLPATHVVNLGDVVLLPGLVDLHAHPDKRPSGSKCGVDADAEFLSRGATTLLSQGDAGAIDFDAWAKANLPTSRARMFMALNLGRRGEAMPGPVLEAADVDVDACVRVVRANPDVIWGLAVNTSRPVTGSNDPRRVLRQAIEAAERADVPLLFGSRRSTDVPPGRAARAPAARRRRHVLLRRDAGEHPGRGHHARPRLTPRRPRPRRHLRP